MEKLNEILNDENIISIDLFTKFICDYSEKKFNSEEIHNLEKSIYEVKNNKTIKYTQFYRSRYNKEHYDVLEECPICKKSYKLYYMNLHYKTDKHIKNILKIKNINELIKNNNELIN